MFGWKTDMKTILISNIKPVDLVDALHTVISGVNCTIYYSDDILPVVAVDQAAIDARNIASAKLATDTTAANAYAKLSALRNMSPAQVQTWVNTNVTNLAQAQDAITTLAIAVSILSRKL